MEAQFNLFFMINGLKGHLQITPDKPEDTVKLLQQYANQLKSIGAEPEPVPARAGGGWKGGAVAKPKIIVAGEKCPKCGSDLEEQTYNSTKDNQLKRVWHCVKRNRDGSGCEFKGDWKKTRQEMETTLNNVKSLTALETVGREIGKQKFQEADNEALKDLYKQVQARLKGVA